MNRCSLRIGLAVSVVFALARTAFAVSASGGNYTNDINGYRIHVFTNSATASNFVVSTGGNVEVLVVAGGGGGGASGGGFGGGGGGGAVTNVTAYAVSAGSNYAVVVGDGGLGGQGMYDGTSHVYRNATNGSPSVFGTISAAGGGFGGSDYATTVAKNGGSGGAGGGSSNGGTPGTGNPGKNGGTGQTVSGGSPGYGGGGGGGAGTAGLNGSATVGGAGGTGLYFSAFAQWGDTNHSGYFGGGGGGSRRGAVDGAGGTGGWGGGGAGSDVNGRSGQAGTGGGGGGADYGGNNVTHTGGKGGSGIVIVRYLLTDPSVVNLAPTNFSGGTAWLNGSLVSTGAAPTTVYIAYGPADGGTDPLAWSNFVAFAGPAVIGGFTTNVAVPVGGTLFYRYAASNSFGLAWASPAQSVVDGAVTLTAPDALARATLSDTATFRVSRPAALTNGALTVNYTIAGTGVGGTDYASIASPVIIADGTTNADITITGLVRPFELPKTVILTLASGGYSMGSPSVATAVVQQANAWYVAPAPTGSDSTGTGSQALPWASVTNALKNANTNDTILVAGGVYTQQVNFTADKDYITIQGGYNASGWSWDPANQKSVIQSTGGNSPVYITYGADSDALNYLTLRGGTGVSKAGVEIQNNGSVTLTESLYLNSCTVTGNYIAVYCNNNGAGSYNGNWTITARSCLIARNNATALYCPYSAGTFYLYNCTVADNNGDGFTSGTASGNPGILPHAKNTVFSGNNGYGVSLPPHWVFPQGTFENCLFFGNANGHYRGPSGDLGSNKCGRDPLYVDRANNDYRLQNASPAAAAGKNLSSVGVTMDILGVARPQGAAWDIGAYEGSGTGEGVLAATVYVKPGGVDDPVRDGSQSQPYATPGFALGYAAPGGLVCVAGGSYTSTISFGPEKDGTIVRGGYDPSAWVWDPSNQVTRVTKAGASVVQICNDCNNAGVGYLTIYGVSSAGAMLPNCNAETFYVDGCSITGNQWGVYSELNGIGLVFRNTILARNSSTPIYCYYASDNIYFYNCTVANNGHSGFYANNGSYVMAKNSIFSGNARFGLEGASSGALDYNLFNGNALGHYSGTYTDGGNNKLNKDPLFVDAANNNYRIQNASPAATAGTSLTSVGVTNDIVAATRPGPNGWDLGAYQGSGFGEPAPVNVAYVSKLGSDTGGNGSSNTPWGSLTYALSWLTSTGRLYVASGVYTENVQLASGTIGIRGGYSASDWSWNPSNNVTVIFGNGSAPVTFLAASSTNTLSYLTLCGGTGANKAGIILGAGVAPIIESCTITGNVYGVYGASLSPVPNPTFRNCIIASNTSTGIYLPWSAGSGLCRFYNCTIANNGSDGFYANEAAGGGASFIGINTIVSGNNGWGVNRGAAVQSASLQNCLFYGNPSGAYTYAADNGGNKIGKDPKYVNGPAGDFRLLNTSPAAAAGTTNVIALGVTNDIVGVTRPGPNGYDMGAYQGSGSGEPPPLPQVYVAKSGSDALGDGSSTNPWATISYGAAYLAPTGTMYIASGVYTENVQLAAGNSSLFIRGGYNAANWQWAPRDCATVIASPNGGSAVTLGGGAYSNTLSYLTLCAATNSGQAGIYSMVGDVLTIEGCTITGNTYGVRFPSVSPGPKVTIRNSIIARNSSQGVEADWTEGNIYLYNCTVADNGSDGLETHSAAGGGANVFAKNTLLTGNTGYGINRGNGGSASIEYCLFYGNTGGATNGLVSNLGNNMFTNAPGYKTNTAYVLTEPSAAIDSGVNLSALSITNDIRGTPRPKGAAYDRGAVEAELLRGTSFTFR